MSVRKPAVANEFYPGDKDSLKRMVLGFLEKAGGADLGGELKAVIVPHAGYIYSGVVAASGYKLVKRLNQEAEWKVLLLGPSHHVPFGGAAVDIYDKWETPLGDVEVRDIRVEIGEKESISDVPEANVEEHSLEVQVPFLQVCLKKFVLYPLILGDVRPDWLAEDLVDFCARKDVVTVVSSDLSHFMSYEEAKKVDLATSEAVCELDIDGMMNKGDACGKGGILTLMHVAHALKWKCRMLEYKNSGDTAGDKDRVVGYGAYAMYD